MRIARCFRWLIVPLLVATGGSPALVQAEGTPVASPVPSVEPSCAVQRDSVHVVALSFDSGNPLPDPELVVYDTTGAERRRIPIQQPQYGYTTAIPGKAIVQDIDGQLHLVDTAAGTSTPLVFPDAEPGDVSLTAYQFRESRGGRYRLMGSPDFQLAYLVDLDSGAVYDLNALLDGDPGPIITAAVSADDRHLLLWAGRQIRLVPLDDVPARRVVGGDATTFGGRFSDDGSAVLYLRAGVDDTSTLMLEAVDGGAPRELATGRIIAGFFLPRERVLVVRADGVGVLDLATGGERAALTGIGQPRTVQIAPSGERLLLALDGDNGTNWLWLDLTSGERRDLTEVTGGVPFLLPGSPGWTTFAPTSNIGQGTPGAAYYGFDLETGEPRPLLSQEENTFYFFPSDIAPGGRWTALPTQSRGDPPLMQMQLFDNQTGQARVVGEGFSLHGVFSPDGCWLAVGTIERTDGASRATLTLIPLFEGEPIEIAGAFIATWVLAPPGA